MKRLLKPSWVQILAGVLFVIGSVIGMLSEGIFKTFMSNDVPFLTSVLASRYLSYVFFLFGYILLLIETRIKAIRISMMLAIGLVVMLSLIDYLIYSEYTEFSGLNYTAGRITNFVYNLLWVYIISILLQHKPLTNVGWLLMIAIVMIVHNGELLTAIVKDFLGFVKVDFADFTGFPYSLWENFIMTNLMATIAYYYMATSEVFNRHRLEYALEVDTSKVFSPFNKWMLAAIVTPVVITASLTIVYLF